MPYDAGYARDTIGRVFAVIHDVLSISFEESRPMKVKNMKRAIGAGAACVALAASVMAGSHRAAGAQSAKTPAREVPRFEADASWAKIPNGWVFGQVASAAADEQDHVWVLHRPRVVRPDQKTGPPVMEFDAAGNYIQGWGGPAEGYAWPQSEHGIYVDYKGYVWIGGSGNDDQILKFTKAGKFVMQIGRGATNASSCSMPTQARTSGCGARSATSRPTTLPPPPARPDNGVRPVPPDNGVEDGRI